MNKTLKNALSILALMALVSLVVVGCGDSSDDEPAADSKPVVSDGWARVTAPGAEMGAAYMNIHSAGGDKLVGVEVPAEIAESAEIHETVMTDDSPGDDSDDGEEKADDSDHMDDDHADDSSHSDSGDDHGSDDTDGSSSHDGTRASGDTMKMQQVEHIELPAGQTVALKPGGFHIMFIDLAEQIKEGQEIELTLIFEKAGRQEVTVKAKS